MKGKLTALSAMAIVAVVALLFSACETDVAYGPCDFDPTIQGVCYAVGAGTKLSCIISDHPTCADRVCLSFQGSTSFCSQNCVNGQDLSCPRGGTCLPFIVQGENQFYCVAPELL